ncbi:enoyl-CoA hydratase [Amycolatopsis mediterranei S699]|uniref:Enoyl-CoA hydratase n=2 Tax=Amycolatopsis mediterranei TaxID=33910 RepID=A0A0H3D641_AMYMU|nr:enoyl-CoA hydratase/isomerase family protein [Amycolatopsis mediterranei]ADJ45588.1 enoyl-CoA hydratase [Amycolatopsis mediterranei U32]AEK42365.1 enoyl-CoA hydratase [Amycolatopsis mediterranei S699]AFO77299.1 enoyl-CoA hydratase [Amycolatopsis mediterranei S699]AGT84427.1 enoyl-CoA hydratase [Amycolatopsis mediterranei RB]KDO05843.1 enoyl-CoA hydratase [Amycolatopsis mediterranei]
MIRELHEVLGTLRDDRSVRVIVFSSANPEFFLAHVDIHILDELAELQEIADRNPDANLFQGVGELLRHQPQVTIVKLAGKARAGGAEFVAAADLTFAARETAGLGQTEVLMGIVPGGGGTQYLRERVGRHRALELLLTADLVDADTAAAYGWINRAVPAAELDAVVDQVAKKIAALSPELIAAAKRLVPPADPADGLKAEHDAWAELVSGPRPAQLMTRALEHGVQTPEGERDLESVMRGVIAALQPVGTATTWENTKQ